LPSLSDYLRTLSFDSVVSRIRNTNTRLCVRFQRGIPKTSAPNELF
jgi:hypothetical protein